MQSQQRVSAGQIAVRIPVLAGAHGYDSAKDSGRAYDAIIVGQLWIFLLTGTGSCIVLGPLAN